MYSLCDRRCCFAVLRRSPAAARGLCPINHDSWHVRGCRLFLCRRYPSSRSTPTPPPPEIACPFSVHVRVWTFKESVVRHICSNNQSITLHHKPCDSGTFAHCCIVAIIQKVVRYGLAKAEAETVLAIRSGGPEWVGAVAARSPIRQEDNGNPDGKRKKGGEEGAGVASAPVVLMAKRRVVMAVDVGSGDSVLLLRAKGPVTSVVVAEDGQQVGRRK